MGVFKNFLIISKLTSLEYKAVHRTKLFGILWKFLNPLLFIGVYTFVFSTLYSGGSRGYVISMGILLFSGISTSINSCTTWVQPKILSFASSPKKLKLLFFSKIYFNFIPIFYLIPVLVFVQRIIFNIDFKFSLLESVEILIQVYLLTIFVMFYCFIVCVPIAIISKRLTDLKDLINHLLRIALYLSPILWVAKTENSLINYLLQIGNPFYFIFETMNYIIYRSYEFAYISLITPFVISVSFYLLVFRKNKFINQIREMVYR